MQTYSVLVADDEPLALSLVEKYVKQIPFLQLIGSHNNALSVLEQLEGFVFNCHLPFRR